MDSFHFQDSSNCSNHENTENAVDTFDEVVGILDMLNLKLAERQPGDPGFCDNSSPFPELSNGNNQTPNSEKSYYETEFDKWRQYSNMAEWRMQNAETEFLNHMKQCRVKNAVHLSIKEKLVSYKAKLQESQNQVKDLEKKLVKSKAKSQKLNTKVQLLQQDIKQEKAECMKWQQKLMESVAQHTNLDKEIKKWKAVARNRLSENTSLEAKYLEMQEKLKKAKKELDDKAYYLKEVERIMEQQKAVLTNTKQKYKKESEEQKELIMNLELCVAQKDGEIEKLSEKLMKLTRKSSAGSLSVAIHQ